ncbi:hypothetical protein ACFL17_01120 [Pseudomonadota bacterium]
MSMLKPKSLLLQAVNYTMFMTMVWYFSFNPPYSQLEEEQAVVTLAFGHAAKRVSECNIISQEELAKLAPNMRKPMDCPRERSPVTIELRLDGKLTIQEVFEAPGLYKDQSIDVYRNIKVPQGEHRLSVWMNDDINVKGPTYQFQQTVRLKPTQRLVLNFDANKNEFTVN